MSTGTLDGDELRRRELEREERRKKVEAIKAKAGQPKPTSSSSSLAGGTSIGTSVRIKPVAAPDAAATAAAEASGDDVESSEEREARRRSLSHNSTLVVQADGRHGFIKSTTSTPSADTSGPKRSISALETSNTSASSSLASSSAASAPVKTPSLSSSGSASPATSSPPVSGSSSPSTSPPSSFTFGDQRRAAGGGTSSFSSSPTGSKLGQSARGGSGVKRSMIIGNRDVKSTAKSLDPASLEESFKEMQQKEDEKAETAELGSSPPAKLSLGMRERKDTWIKPKTTYCKDVDVFRSAVDDRNQFNGEWFTQIQLTVKKEMAWINDEREGIIGMQHKLVALTEEWARALLRTRQAATSASSLQRSEISVKDISAGMEESCYRLAPCHWARQERKMEAYAELVRTLKENPEYLAHAVTCKDFNPPQVDSMMQMVTWSLHSDFYRPHANKELMYFTRRVAELQFAEYAQKPGNFLRLNSQTTKLFTFIAKHVEMSGVEYLKCVLGPPIKYLLNLSSTFPYTLDTEPQNIFYHMSDAEKKEFGENVDINTIGSHEKMKAIVLQVYEKIAEVCRVFIEAIFHKLPAMPYEIRWMAKILLRMAHQRKPAVPPEQVQMLLSDFLFLRYFNPPISSPEPWGICSESAIDKRGRHNLAQVAKAVLSLARGTSFGSAITDGESPIQRLFQAVDMGAYFEAVVAVAEPEHSLMWAEGLYYGCQRVVVISHNELIDLHTLIKELPGDKLEALDSEGKMKALLNELGPVPEKLTKKDDNYFILTINNAAARDFARTMRLLQDPKQFGFFEDEGEDSSDDEDGGLGSGSSPRTKRKGGSKRRGERKAKAKEKPLTEDEKRAKEERRQLRQASRKLLRAMCHMRGMSGYRDRPIIDILSAEYEMIEQMDYPVVEMLLEETIRCLTSLPAALKQSDFTPVLQAIEADHRVREGYRTELPKEKRRLLISATNLKHIIGQLEREEDLYIEYLNSARLRKFRDTYTRQVERFVDQFKSFESVNQKRELIASFLGRLREVIHNHSLWHNASVQEVDFACIDSERYLMRLAFSSAFSPNAPFDEERDLVFEKHIGSLQDLSLDHPVFGLSPTFHQLPFHLARKELKKINNYFSPHDKLECIWRCCQIVSNLLKLSSRKSDAIYFKLLVFVIVQTNPPRLLSNTAYIENFSSPEELNSESGFWFTQFCSAVNHLRNVNVDAAEKLPAASGSQLRRSGHVPADTMGNGSGEKWELRTERGGNKVKSRIRTPSMIFNSPLSIPIAGLQSLASVMPVSEGPLSTSIALKRRRGNSLSSPLSSPRERHTYAQLSPVNNSSSSPVNSPPSASTFSSSSSSSHSASPYSVGARSSIETSPRTALRNTLRSIRASRFVDLESSEISDADVSQLLSEYKELVGIVKTVSSLQEQ